ncbi:hypothetical protein [Nocardia stercoris]|uniref:hypothetical protein n=1 Tax=Nocardia stercoris TaxID=2483361 RepID=UPI0011C43ADF|nr:hypothetical protein [Nocardia stercoris]
MTGSWLASGLCRRADTAACDPVESTFSALDRSNRPIGCRAQHRIAIGGDREDPAFTDCLAAGGVNHFGDRAQARAIGRSKAGAVVVIGRLRIRWWGWGARFPGPRPAVASLSAPARSLVVSHGVKSRRIVRRDYRWTLFLRT